jgi:hypothetical protein
MTFKILILHIVAKSLGILAHVEGLPVGSTRNSGKMDNTNLDGSTYPQANFSASVPSNCPNWSMRPVH